MRYSLALATAIGIATLATVTSCSSPPAGPDIRGMVVEMEYEPATKGKTTESCKQKKQEGGRYKETCSPKTTGNKAECFELDIRTEDGDVTEVCDKAAYMVLDVGDLYDSTRNYNREEEK